MCARDRDEPSGTDPAAAFQTLAHPIRIGTVTTLGTGGPLAYDRLRQRVGVRDNGKFNYHLNELRGRFVEQDGDRYRLTPAGRRVCELVAAGTLERVDATRSLETHSSCHECSGRLEATYDGATVHLDCTACGTCYRSVRFPPGGVDTWEDDVLEAVDATARANVATLGQGVCPRCRGRVTTEATTDAVRESQPASLAFGFEYRCRACPSDWTTTVGEAVLDHPAVVAFYRDHGVDVRDAFAWEFEFAATDRDTRVRSRDPLRLELRPTCDGEELVLVVDGNGSVVRSSRHTKFTARDTWFDRPVEV